MSTGNYIRDAKIGYDLVTDSMRYMGKPVPDHIAREAERMQRQGIPRSLIEEYLAQVMRIEHECKTAASQAALRRLADEYPPTLSRPSPIAPSAPTHPKELLCLL